NHSFNRVIWNLLMFQAWHASLDHARPEPFSGPVTTDGHGSYLQAIRSPLCRSGCASDQHQQERMDGDKVIGG
ncbi:hypothetical protein, partial [Muricoccus aerilatus]|uniref:hypothetical protein n=1 Tax=Muricoccus aerilatus TaxID=452982 RepID=UPI0005C159B4